MNSLKRWKVEKQKSCSRKSVGRRVAYLALSPDLTSFFWDQRISENAFGTNHKTNEDDSQSDPDPKASVSQSQATHNLGPDDAYDRYGSEFQHLSISLCFIIKILYFFGLFLIYSYRKNFSADFSSVLYEMQIWHLWVFFSVFEIFFKITTNFLNLSLIVFSGMLFWSMQRAVYAEDRQVLTNNKMSPLQSFSVVWGKTNSTENRMHQVFRYQKFLKTPKNSITKFFRTETKKKFDEKRETQLKQSFSISSISESFRNTKRAPSRNFSWRQKISTKFCEIPSLVHQNVCTQQMASTRHFQKHQRLPEIHNWPPYSLFSTVRQKVFDVLWWHPQMAYRSFRAGQMSSFDLDLFSACFYFRPKNFEK